jgi:hypothetical protein
MISWPVFDFIDSLNGLLVTGIRTKPVNGLGWKSYQAASFQNEGCRLDLLSGCRSHS